MLVGLAVGLLVGVVIGLGVAALARRRRAQVVIAELTAIDPSFRAADPRDHAGVSRSVRRVAEDLVERNRTVERDGDRLVRALEELTEGVVVCDENGAVVFTNRVGALLADARHEDALVAAAVTEALRSAIAGDESTRSVELFGPPAQTITVEARPIGSSEDPLGAVATIADQSRLRRLESVRSDFVANVSHELKTPVGGLALLAEALGMAEDPVEQERLSARLLHEAHRVGRVVEDLLTLSEIEADLRPRRERVSVAELTGRVVEEVAVLADAFGVTVDTSEVDETATVVGDLVQLTSAVANLVENAIKYSGDATRVQLGAIHCGSMVEITVVDEGIGIPRGDLDRVFERFYRVDQARSRATGGTGLGLSIVRNVVDGHAGEIDLVSREGEGTTVTVRLPAGEVSARPAGAPEARPS